MFIGREKETPFTAKIAPIGYIIYGAADIQF
jgi:hypothetical protein